MICVSGVTAPPVTLTGLWRHSTSCWWAINNLSIEHCIFELSFFFCLPPPGFTTVGGHSIRCRFAGSSSITERGYTWHDTSKWCGSRWHQQCLQWQCPSIKTVAMTVILQCFTSRQDSKVRRFIVTVLSVTLSMTECWLFFFFLVVWMVIHASHAVAMRRWRFTSGRDSKVKWSSDHVRSTLSSRHE